MVLDEVVHSIFFPATGASVYSSFTPDKGTDPVGKMCLIKRTDRDARIWVGKHVRSFMRRSSLHSSVWHIRNTGCTALKPTE